MIRWFCDLCDSEIELRAGLRPVDFALPITPPEKSSGHAVATCVLCKTCWGVIQKTVDGLRKKPIAKESVQE